MHRTKSVQNAEERVGNARLRTVVLPHGEVLEVSLPVLPEPQGGGGALVAVALTTSFVALVGIAVLSFRGGSVSVETPFTTLNLDVNPPKQPPSGRRDDEI